MICPVGVPPPRDAITAKLPLVPFEVKSPLMLKSAPVIVAVTPVSMVVLPEPLNVTAPDEVLVPVSVE